MELCGKIIEKLEDIYTYMDITKLYFPYGKVTTRAIEDNDQAQAEVRQSWRLTGFFPISFRSLPVYFRNQAFILFLIYHA